MATMAPVRTGTMTGAMQRSTHSLRHKARTRIGPQRHAAAGRAKARRYSSHAGEIALIHSDFAHRFHLAMQEVCAATRVAMMQRLNSEKKAALTRVWLLSATEANAVRTERYAARKLRQVFRIGSHGCCARQRIDLPEHPKVRRQIQMVRIKPTR